MITITNVMEKYDFIQQSKTVLKVIYCIRQLFKNKIDRKFLIEYCQSNHIFQLSDSMPLLAGDEKYDWATLLIISR